MKKLILIISIAFVGCSCKGQYPIGGERNKPIIIKQPKIDWLKIPSFKDTLQANKTNIKDKQGSFVLIDSVKIYFRDNDRWIEILPAGGGTGLLPEPYIPKSCYHNCKCNKKQLNIEQ